MAYPSSSDVQAWAQANQASPIRVYAYAAVNGGVPLDTSAFQAFEHAVDGQAAVDGYSSEYLYDYAQAHGTYAVNAGTLAAWVRDRGYVDANGAILLGPSPGAGYPPGGAPSVVSAPPSGPPEDTSGPLDIFAPVTNIFKQYAPWSYAGVAAAAYLAVFGVPRIGRRY